MTRVVLLGDSFVHGDEVPFEETLGAQLEEVLRAGGRATEVLNLGVAGYGMGQALLRLRSEGAALHPDVVVFGFQPENVARNVNLARTFLWWKSGIPFTKPRFVLDPGGGLVAVNHPTLPPDRFLETCANPASWDLIRHEHFFDPGDYRVRWWSGSRLISTGVQALTGWLGRRDPMDGLYDIGGEPCRVTLAILGGASEEARHAGARFVLVHLPIQRDLDGFVQAGRLVYRDLLERVRSEHELVDPLEDLAGAARRRGVTALYTRPGGGHYTRETNRIVAESLAAVLSEG